MQMPEFLMKLLSPDAVGGKAMGATEPPWVAAYNDMQTKYMKYHRYYSGGVLQEIAEPKKGEGSGLKYPLQLNMTRTWSHMKASYLFGEWTDSVVTFKLGRRKKEDGEVADAEEKRATAMEDFLRREWRRQGNDARADAAAIDMMVYGGAVAKVYWDNIDERVRTDWLSPVVYCPRWHPTDVNRLMAVYIRFEIAREDAHDIYKVDIKGMPPMVELAEEWTAKTYKVTIDGKVVRDVPNKLGFIPHIYIPRIRTPDNYGYYGLSLLADTMAIQDEVNARAADIGDGVSYGSHPIRYVVNYMGKEDLEVGADVLWDLGKQMGNRVPKAGVLDTKSNYKEGMEFVNSVQTFGRNAVALPPIAFGEDEGSQRSSLTLLVRYQPLMQEVRRERLQLASGLENWARKVLTLGVAHDLLPEVEQRHVDDATIDTKFAPVMPQSVEDIVNRWNIRITGGFGTPEEAYTELGHPDPARAAKDAFAYQRKLEKIKQKEVQNVNEGIGRGGKDGGNAAPGGSNVQSGGKANQAGQGRVGKGSVKK